MTPIAAPSVNQRYVQNAQIAHLESRLNGQQKRIADNENFIKKILAELHLQREAIKNMGAPLRPVEAGKSVAYRLRPTPKGTR